MTDYAKWDRFAAEIDSDSDGASEPDIAAPPFSSPSSSEGHKGTDVVHANRRSNANFNSTSTSAASRSDEYGGGGSERDLKYKLLAENLVEVRHQALILSSLILTFSLTHNFFPSPP